MSDNRLRIKLAFEPNSMSEEKLRKIYEYPLRWGEIPHSIRDSPEKVHELINKSINNDLIQDGDSLGVDYLWFNTHFRRRKLDFFFIDLDQGNLNAGQLIEKGHATLNKVYESANRFIAYVKYVWEVGGDGLWASGDCDIIYDTLFDFKLSESEKASHFWLTLLSKKYVLPEKYSYGMSSQGKPSDEFPWYKKEKIQGGTLLLSSPLPYWSINETPAQTFEEKEKGLWAKTQWAQFEEKWKLLETKK